MNLRYSGDWMIHSVQLQQPGKKPSLAGEDDIFVVSLQII
jgi:hypothetical protein